MSEANVDRAIRIVVRLLGVSAGIGLIYGGFVYIAPLPVLFGFFLLLLSTGLLNRIVEAFT